MNDVAWRWRWPAVNAELLVSKAAAEVLSSHRQPVWGVERGGQLFVDPANSAGLILSLATPPHASDRAGWAWLELDAARCQQEVERANANGLRLVGYWHTHPQAVPAISPADIKSFSTFAARYTRDLPHPIAIIVGQSKQPGGTKAWSFRDERYIEASWTK